MITQKIVSVTEEKRVVVGLIVSTEFCQKIKPILKLDYFVNSYLRTLATWCDEFFETYKKAPFKHIKDIFHDEVNAQRLNETEAELIEKLLTDLDNQYGEEEINLDYWVESAGEYFRSREIEITINNIAILKEKGNLEEAEKALLDFQKVEFPVEDHVLINPGNLETQEEIYKKRDEEEVNFFILPGDLGKYLGNQKRGDVVSYFGPAKRGKCVGENSLIYLSDGTIKTIKEVVDKKLDNILCMDENKKITKGKVVDWLHCGLKQEHTLLTRSGRKIKTSKDHKFYTPEGWKSLDELKKDDLVAIAKNTDIEWDKVKKITKSKIVPMYDLTIEKNHNYISDGFIVHNSHLLINQFKHGVLSRRRTLFFSVEMTATEVLPKINQAFFPMTKEEGTYSFPVFDCKHNQGSACADRLTPVYLEYNASNGSYFYDPNHVPCTLCKGHKDYETRKKYDWITWMMQIKREKDDIFAVRKEYPKFQKMWNKYGRLSVHKKYSLTYDLMMKDIDILWQKQGWFPDILIIDYIDILQINSKFDDYRLDDEKWKLLAKIAGETNTLVITATQANKEGHKTDSLDSTHQGGFYGKNRHVNLMVGLNQQKEDKKKGIMRLGITEARSQEFHEDLQCVVLQDFKSGQAFLDSFTCYKESTPKTGGKKEGKGKKNQFIGHRE